MNAADFRHGPLELVCPGFAALVFAGLTGTTTLNRKLALDILKNGGHAFWIDVKNDLELPTISIPETNETTHVFVEILLCWLLRSSALVYWGKLHHFHIYQDKEMPRHSFPTDLGFYPTDMSSGIAGL